MPRWQGEEEKGQATARKQATARTKRRGAPEQDTLPPHAPLLLPLPRLPRMPRRPPPKNQPKALAHHGRTHAVSHALSYALSPTRAPCPCRTHAPCTSQRMLQGQHAHSPRARLAPSTPKSSPVTVPPHLPPWSLQSIFARIVLASPVSSCLSSCLSVSLSPRLSVSLSLSFSLSLSLSLSTSALFLSPSPSLVRALSLTAIQFFCSSFCFSLALSLFLALSLSLWAFPSLVLLALEHGFVCSSPSLPMPRCL